MSRLGYRFMPRERELIFLLRKKVLGRPIECAGVVEKRLYDANPWEVFVEDDPWEHDGDIVDHRLDSSKKMRSFIHVFTRLKSTTKNSKRKQRTAGMGTWAGQSRPEEILDGQKELIGFKKTFTFEAKNGQTDIQCPGHWIMYEYSLGGVSLNEVGNQHDAVVDVVCKIIRSNWVPESLTSAFKRPRWPDAENPPSKKQRPLTRTLDRDDDGDLIDELNTWLNGSSDLASDVVPVVADLPVVDDRCSSGLTHPPKFHNAEPSELLPLREYDLFNSQPAQVSDFNGDGGMSIELEEFDVANSVASAVVPHLSIEEEPAPLQELHPLSWYVSTQSFDVSASEGLEEVDFEEILLLLQEPPSDINKAFDDSSETCHFCNFTDSFLV